MTLKSFFSGLFISLFGCSPTIYTRGVPNLVQVGPGLWRSGQPTTIDSWNYLKSLGINHIVKLNFDSEGSDDEATMSPLHVTQRPQRLHDDRHRILLWVARAGARQIPKSARTEPTSAKGRGLSATTAPSSSITSRNAAPSSRKRLIE